MDALNQLLKNDVVILMLGIVIGGIMIAFSTYLQNRSNTKLKILEKLIDKKMEAHGALIDVLKSMRYTVVQNEDIPDERYPIMFTNQDAFDEWHVNFTHIINVYLHWFDHKLRGELYFIQDYLFNLLIQLKNCNEKQYEAIGIIVKLDFFSLASSLERRAFSFFNKGIRMSKNLDLEKRQGIGRKKTAKRLNRTELFRRKGDIDKIKNESEE